MGDFFSMGGYAAFVWPAFALSFGVLAALLIASLKSLRESERALGEVEPNKIDSENQAA